MQFNQRLQDKPEITNEFRDWNMQLGKNLVQVEGRFLDKEKLVFHNEQTLQLDEKADWDLLVAKCPMLVTVPLKDWVAVVPQKDMSTFQSFLSVLVNGAAKMRFQIDKPLVKPINNDRAASYMLLLEDILSKSALQLVMCICSNNQLERYSAIKKKCCVDRPIPSQVCKTHSISVLFVFFSFLEQFHDKIFFVSGNSVENSATGKTLEWRCCQSCHSIELQARWLSLGRSYTNQGDGCLRLRRLPRHS